MRVILFFLSLTILLQGQTISLKAPASIEPELPGKHSADRWCDRSGYGLAHTYLINYRAHLSDGTTKRYAALRFLAEDFDAIKDRVTVIEVVDAQSGAFIDVQNAFFVLNSSLGSPYSKYLKIAFAKKRAAEEFIRKYGGDIRDFDFALYMATRDIQLDEKYRKNRDERSLKRGQRIYEKVCEEVDPLAFSSLKHLKTHLQSSGVCKRLNERNLQALTRYLWEVKRLNKEVLAQKKRIEVPKSAKCPVCGMFVAKYPKWAAKIAIKGGHAHYFDGVKDMMKYFFHPEKFKGGHSAADFEKITVSDYYTLEPLEAKSAFYVIGSNIYGPMGNELIPFATREQAQNFSDTHFGKKILTFEQITPEIVFALDH